MTKKDLVVKGLLLASFMGLMNKPLSEAGEIKYNNQVVYFGFQTGMDYSHMHSWKEKNLKEFSNKKPNKNIGGLEVITEKLDDTRVKVLFTIETLMKNPIPKKFTRNCWTIANLVYDSAKVNFTYAYSDPIGKKYTVNKHKVTVGDSNFAVPSSQQSSHELSRQNRKEIIFEEKLDKIEVGDIIAYAHTSYIGHNAIFLGWKNKEKGIANLLDGRKNFMDRFWYQVFEDNLKEYPVFIYWKPTEEL